mmetsp:Transcript_2647/g.5392  ORF Transcript_2647/g.5392 Transcript_2647/m.5392 type:complete len:231 (-) Transcript_2647:124-816(-)
MEQTWDSSTRSFLHCKKEYDRQRRKKRFRAFSFGTPSFPPTRPLDLSILYIFFLFLQLQIIQWRLLWITEIRVHGAHCWQAWKFHAATGVVLGECIGFRRGRSVGACSRRRYRRGCKSSLVDLIQPSRKKYRRHRHGKGSKNTNTVFGSPPPHNFGKPPHGSSRTPNFQDQWRQGPFPNLNKLQNPWMGSPGRCGKAQAILQNQNQVAYQKNDSHTPRYQSKGFDIFSCS